MIPDRSYSDARNVLSSAARRTLHFGHTELRHLVIGTTLVTAVGVSFFIGSPLTGGLPELILASLLFALGFILHELAHKYVAQGYGLWAEFRVNTMGLMLTAMSVVSPIKFIAPGAVVISGFTDIEKMGRIALAGPVVNVAITAVLYIVMPAFRETEVYAALLTGAAINSFLAMFNLIPFAVLDGKKIYSWNRRYWVTLFVIALALTAYTYSIMQAFI